MPIPPVPLQRHLLFEVMDEVRMYDDGRKLLRFGFAGKENFAAFQSIVRDIVVVVIPPNQTVCIRSGGISQLRDVNFYFGLFLSFDICLHRKLVASLASRLRVCLSRALRLPDYVGENVTELTIGGKKNENISIVRRIRFWSNLEVLKVNCFSNTFISGVNAGAIKLDRLKRLELYIKFDQLHKLLKTGAKFPFPEDVTIFIGYKHVSHQFKSALKFPKVKHLRINIENCEDVLDVLVDLPTIFRCFPNVNVAKVEVYDVRDGAYKEFENVEQLQLLVKNAVFTIPVEIKVFQVLFITNHHFDADELLTMIGFKQSNCIYNFKSVKENPRVELDYRLVAHDECNQHPHADHFQLYLEILQGNRDDFDDFKDQRFLTRGFRMQCL